MLERGLVKTSGGYMHYRCAGKGKALILVHPALSSSTAYLDVLPHLARGCRPIAVDLIGYGDSDRPSQAWSLHAHAEVILELGAALGLARFSILGEAMGALIATEVAVTEPGKVEGLILQNTPFWVDEQMRHRRHNEPGKLFTVNEDGFPNPRTAQESLARDPEHAPMKPIEIWADRNNADLAKLGRWITKGFEMQSAQAYKEALEKVTCPALLVYGEHFFYRSYQNELTKRLRDSRVSVIAGTRWMPQVEQPEETSRAILDFITSSGR